ncbi:PAS domain-containing protein, partial [Candidatus Pacearchaeota archaeon]|nr:PAS domain-containing protein [Candidatus Pacearchaeota archaeon]
MKLHAKITLLTTSAVLLISLFSLTLMDKLLRDRFDYELRAKGQILVEGLSESIAKDVIDSEILSVTDVLSKIVERTQHIVYAYIVGFDGHVFAHTFEKGFPKKLLTVQHPDDDDFFIVNKYLLEGKKVVDVSYPLIKGLKAYVHIGMDKSYHHAQDFSFRNYILALSVIVILLGLISSLLISRRIIMPMKELSRYVNAFGKGTLTDTIEISHAAPEVAQLAQSFSQMVVYRKEAEKALQESQVRMKAIFETVQAGIVIIDCEKRQIIDANPVALKMMDISKKELVGKTCNEVFCIPQGGICPIIDLEKKTENAERQLIKTNDEQIPILKSVIEFDLQGRKCLLESFLDLTPLKQSEKEKEEMQSQIQQMQKMEAIGTLAGGIAHDFNNMLMPIMSYAQ